MKNTMFISLLLLCIIVCLTACDLNDLKADREGNDGRMIIVFSDGFAVIYVDTQTGVQYYNYNGGACVMVDENGKPLLYKKHEDTKQ